MELSKSALRDFCDAAEALGMFIGSDYKGRVIHYADRNEAFLGAVMDGDARKVQFFLNGGADVNYKDALQAAVSRDHVEVAKILLLNGAELYRDTRAKDLLPGGSETPLVCAARSGKLAMVQAFLAYGPVVEADKARARKAAYPHEIRLLLETNAKSDSNPSPKP